MGKFLKPGRQSQLDNCQKKIPLPKISHNWFQTQRPFAEGTRLTGYAYVSAMSTRIGQRSCPTKQMVTHDSEDWPVVWIAPVSPDRTGDRNVQGDTGPLSALHTGFLGLDWCLYIQLAAVLYILYIDPDEVTGQWRVGSRSYWFPELIVDNRKKITRMSKSSSPEQSAC